MKFVDRRAELERLDRLMARPEGGLAVLHGRRRIGKTRLLLEWAARHGGLYTVADQSAAPIQRGYFAESVARVLPGFADVDYGTWRALLERLARDAAHAGFRGPIILDELPYLVQSSPELPSVLQRWVDHDAKSAGLVVALSGSSQRMMQGAVLSREAPLFGRAHEILALEPMPIGELRSLVSEVTPRRLVELYAAWGGVPRYWELAIEESGPVPEVIERLVLDPLGPLHREPDRLLLEELPAATEVRPVLDAIGSGAHRISEIGGRLGRPATSMSRPLQRLIEMGLVEREVPFGVSEKESRRSLYRICDPFFRLWFEVVAPHRALLAAGTRETRLLQLERSWARLVAQAWEELVRRQVPRVGSLPGGPWGPARRWWRGNDPEWDVVSASLDGKRLLLGEVKWFEKMPSRRQIAAWAAETATRRAPILPESQARLREVRVLMVPEDPDIFGLPIDLWTAGSVLPAGQA